MVMTVMVFIWLTSRRIVAEDVRVLSLFGTKPGYECGRRRARRLTGSIWRRKQFGFVIPGCAERRRPKSIVPRERQEKSILRCAIAHHSWLASLAPRNDGKEAGSFCHSDIPAPSVPAARGEDLVKADHDLKADQEHDDDLEPQRAARVDDVGERIGGARHHR